MRHTMLIADDEQDILNMLWEFFESREYLVLAAGNGKEALRLAERQPDIILLDVSMPGLDGISACAHIRDFVSCPILFLTARIEDADKVRGFAAGGDDYITKPFSLTELEARVAAHLRREARRPLKGLVRFDHDLCIDYAERTVHCKNQMLRFTKKEFDIIELLSESAGQVFDKERIYEAVWGYDGQGDSSVIAEHIRRIRAKLTDAGGMACIETVWGCGYKWKK